MNREITPNQISLIYDPDKCSIYAKRLGSCYLLKLREKITAITEQEYKEYLDVLTDNKKPTIKVKKKKVKSVWPKNNRPFCFCGKRAGEGGACLRHRASAKAKAARDKISLAEALEQLEKNFFLRLAFCPCGKPSYSKGLCHNCYHRERYREKVSEKD
jgi:hypothetical protein